MSDLHPALAAFAAQRTSEFTALVGIEFAAIERGSCTLRLPITDKHFNSTHRVHGGVVFTEAIVGELCRFAANGDVLLQKRSVSAAHSFQSEVALAVAPVLSMDTRSHS